jgi:hypothetical protein
LAEVHLARGEGDAAAKYLYATLNHGTPLYTWCEERGQEKGTTTCTGDRQHLWTPVAVVRCLRDCLVMEDGGGKGLELGLGIDREWLASGEPVGIAKASTHFGDVTYAMRYDAEKGVVKVSVTAPKRVQAEWVRVHVRLPGGMKVASVKAKGGAVVKVEENGEAIRWVKPEGRLEVEVGVGKG